MNRSISITYLQTYKTACLSFTCHNSAAPCDVINMPLKKPSHSRSARSSSHTMPLPNRFFASSSVWNSTPNDVRCAPKQSSLKSRLNAFLLHPLYLDWVFHFCHRTYVRGLMTLLIFCHLLIRHWCMQRNSKLQQLYHCLFILRLLYVMLAILSLICAFVLLMQCFFFPWCLWAIGI